MFCIIEELTQWAVYHLKGFDVKILKSDKIYIRNFGYIKIEKGRATNRQLTIFDMLEGEDLS